MKVGLISLGGPSSKDILKKCKDYFSKTKDLNIKEIETHMTFNGLHINYQGRPLEHFDCLYIRGSYKYALLKKSITLAKSIFEKIIQKPSNNYAQVAFDLFPLLKNPPDRSTTQSSDGKLIWLQKRS